MKGKETLGSGKRGSVSVYLAGVMAAVMMFMGGLIDLARIAVFERLAESSAYAGVRSALSAYDGSLYARYGLFGRGGSDGDAIFARVVQGHLSQDAESWRLLRPQLDSSVLYAGDMLGLHAVLERQILEEMKYKGPADFAMELVERIRPLSGAMSEAAQTVRTLEEVRKLYDSRQRRLEDALRLQQEAAAAVAGSGLDRLLPYPAGYAADGTAAGAAAQYAAYVEWVQADMALQEDEEPQYTAAIAAYASMARGVSGSIQNVVNESLARHERLIREAQIALADAEAVNSRMAAAVQQADRAAAGSGGDAGSAANGTSAVAGAGGPALDEFRSLRAEAQALVLENAWFDRYRQELQTQEADLAGIHAAASSFISAVSGALAVPSLSSSYPLSSSSAAVQRAYGLYAARYISPGSVTAERGRAIAELQTHKDQQAALEQQADGKRAEARAFLRRFGELPRTAEAEQAFERLRTLYEANRAMNEAVEHPPADDASSAGGEEAEDESEYARDSMNKADGLFGGMLSGFRDEFYLNEYAVSRFTYFQPQTLSDWVNPREAGGGADISGGAAGQAAQATETSAALTVSNQETEYIIYGYHDPVSNIAAAFGEVFAIRLAVRTMEGLIECRALGHPLVVLAGAIVYGLEQALADMVTLVAEGSTKLSRWVPLDITYKDYLRLFLLLHGSRDSKLSRIAALIEWNTGTQLSEIPAAVRGEAQMSVELWFLPGVMKFVEASGNLNGKVVGSRYERTVVAGSSY